MQSKPPNPASLFPSPAGASVSPSVKEVKAGLVQAPLLLHNRCYPVRTQEAPVWRAPERTDPQV